MKLGISPLGTPPIRLVQGLGSSHIYSAIAMFMIAVGDRGGVVKQAWLQTSRSGFSLDDFGTGYSSLSHLKRLPLDQLKVDRAFVNDLLVDDRDASIASTIIALGRNLNLTVIAESVETEGQREFLEDEGCLIYQGFLFSPALSCLRFEAFVAAHDLVKERPVKITKLAASTP